MEVISKAVKKSTKQSTAKTKTNNTDNFNTKNQLKEDNQQEQSNKTKLLLDLIEHEELFHDEQKNPFITFKNGDHYETWPLGSIVFKEWLSYLFWKTYSKSIHGPALMDALSVLNGKAIHDGKCHKIFTRMGCAAGKIYINTANPKWQIIEISEAGWQLLDKSPIKFTGLQNMQPLPIPVRNQGNFNLIWSHINIPETEQLLVMTWLLDTFIVDTPYPIMMLTGFHGSGKSKTQERLRELIDPSSSNLRNPPKNSDDIFTAAQNNYLVSYNNMSKLTNENQDDLCCLSTGGGFAKRRLYTVGEEYVIDIKRPIIMNGISDIITRQDLLDRAICIALPVIEPTKRKDERELDNSFNNDLPYIFTGLLEILVKVLRHRPHIRLLEKPRMASFALLGEALERALNLPANSFADAYQCNYQGNMLSVLDNSPVAVAVMGYLQDELNFSGTYLDLLDKLNFYRPRQLGWPTSPKGLANSLRRLAPGLALVGINLLFGEKHRNDGYHIEISRVIDN